MRRILIEDDNGERQDRGTFAALRTITKFIHPSPALFRTGARIRIKVEMRDNLIAFFDLEETHARIPNGRLFGNFLDGHMKENIDEMKEPGQYIFKFEIALEFVF